MFVLTFICFCEENFASDVHYILIIDFVHPILSKNGVCRRCKGNNEKCCAMTFNTRIFDDDDDDDKNKKKEKEKE